MIFVFNFNIKKIKIRIWARQDYINNTEYAYNIMPKIYKFYHEYFDINEVVRKSGKIKQYYLIGLQSK